MLFAAVLTMCQNTDERNPFTAMLAIHGWIECIWGAKPAEADRKGNRRDTRPRRAGWQDRVSLAGESRDKVAALGGLYIGAQCLVGQVAQADSLRSF
jgi:hypothetical protein